MPYVVNALREGAGPKRHDYASTFPASNRLRPKKREFRLKIAQLARAQPVREFVQEA
jgi:hypothetical protein